MAGKNQHGREECMFVTNYIYQNETRWNSYFLMKTINGCIFYHKMAEEIWYNKVTHYSYIWEKLEEI